MNITINNLKIKILMSECSKIPMDLNYLNI